MIIYLKILAAYQPEGAMEEKLDVRERFWNFVICTVLAGIYCFLAIFCTFDHAYNWHKIENYGWYIFAYFIGAIFFSFAALVSYNRWQARCPKSK